MTSITRREWLERIRQHLICLSAMEMHLIGEWYSLSDEERERQAEVILGEMKTIIKMIKSIHLFEDSDGA